MTMTFVEYVDGRGDLGKWGSIELSGARSALVHSRVGEDFELPEDVAADLTGPSSRTVLNPEAGTLFFFPSDGDLIHAYDINNGQPIFDPIAFEGEEDTSFRWRGFWILESGGLLYISEHALFHFGEDMAFKWAVRDDFAGWDLGAQDARTVTMELEDFGGRIESRRYRLSDGMIVD